MNFWEMKTLNDAQGRKLSEYATFSRTTELALVINR